MFTILSKGKISCYLLQIIISQYCGTAFLPSPSTCPNFVFVRFCMLTNIITLSNVVVITTSQADAYEAISMRHAPLR